MKKYVDYTCPMCGKPGQAEYFDDVPINLDYWVKLLHCNRCADYKALMMKLQSDLSKQCWNYVSETGIKKTKQDRKQNFRNSIIKTTQSIARNVCGYYKTVYTWEPDFAEQCMEHPDKITEVVNTYIRMIKAKVRPQTVLSSDHHRTADSK